MGRDDFLRRVNWWAATHGAPPLTERQLRHLIDERVVPGPTRQSQKGQRTPIWNWGRYSYRRALQVCRLRAQGAKSFAELRLLFWIRGNDNFSESVRTDLARVFKRMRSEITRSIGSDDPGPVTGKDASKARISRIGRKLGQPSPLLRPEGFAFPQDQLAAASDVMRFDIDNERPFAQLLTSLIENIGLPPPLRNQFLQLAGPALDMFSGLIGDPDETNNSAVAIVSETTADVFVHARSLTRQEVRSFPLAISALSSIPGVRFEAWKAPFHVAASAVKTPAWQIAEFVRWLHWAHNATAKERSLFEA
jgi:hypothetical protein